jgi:hypothetical protein
MAHSIGRDRLALPYYMYRDAVKAPNRPCRATLITIAAAITGLMTVLSKKRARTGFRRGGKGLSWRDTREHEKARA